MRSRRMFGQKLQRGFDVIGFDPRGVGSSTPVKCEKPAEQDASRAEQFDTGTDAGLAAMRKASAAYAALCAERTGDRPWASSTPFPRPATWT